MIHDSKFKAGVDIGSAYSKAVMLDSSDNILGWSVIPSGNDYRAAANKVLELAIKKAGLSPDVVLRISSTGYGATSVSQTNKTISEITAQGAGVNFLFPSVRTIIDIGAQFSRVFRVDGKGNVIDFVISEKCAAGSGRLLQVIARVLQVDIGDLGALSKHSTQRVDFTTNCAVFIESEVISRIAEGAKKEDIIAGVQRSLAAKVQVLAERVGFVPDFAFTGGAANNTGLVSSIEEAFKTRIIVPELPQITAALGAAINGNR